MTGEGLLVLPRVADDIEPVADMVSLHAADWDYAIGNLGRRGRGPSEDDGGDLVHVGTTVDGHGAYRSRHRQQPGRLSDKRSGYLIRGRWPDLRLLEVVMIEREAHQSE
ncbi:hypothetical protein [Micromonospora sp. AMSO31t]|uniref:hypothetical protein n=1 Tax=Micromonospora sp. AMSO31t TaxID=2650566 RepID=UPI00124B2C50|nr:hypothetical protein [Micromonospora sp. AMSO31t]KAB1912682.1 hypothetical protein F8274_13135 [Micromonospora sp. AMSO31t]